jgi:hypothetical protein
LPRSIPWDAELGNAGSKREGGAPGRAGSIWIEVSLVFMMGYSG